MKRLLLLLLLTISLPAISQTCNSSITASTPDSRFIVSGQEVADLQTGLIWQKCSLGQSGSDCLTGSAHAYTWTEALQAAASMRQQTGQSWRLPNVKELRSIVEERCYNPSLNARIFQNTPSNRYFTDSQDDDFWIFEDIRCVEFYHGISGEFCYDSFYEVNVRLVRTGQ